MSLIRVFCLVAFIVGIIADDEIAENEVKDQDQDQVILPPDIYEQIAMWEGRIVGGRTAQPGQFPHQVSFRLTSGFHFCGGSLLSEYYALSAAHCFQRHNSIPANVRMAVGSYRRLNDGTVYQLAYIFNHPHYNDNLKANDIAIVQTASKVHINSVNVRPIALPTQNLPIAGNQQVIVSGWGQTAHVDGAINPVADVLQFKTAVTLSRTECVRRLGSLASMIHTNVVCTINPAQRGTCMGDSGGPLITTDNVVVGVVSWGVPCARGYPDVYSNVYDHVNWLNSIMQRR